MGNPQSGTVPVQILSDVAVVAKGARHTMIIRTDESLWAMGYNTCGQLGDGTTEYRSSPVQVMTGVDAVGASRYTGGGQSFSMILKTDGTLWATGYNGKGQLCDGTTSWRSTPLQVMNDVAYVSVGDEYTMIIKTDGSCWGAGYNVVGQLGNGTTTTMYTPGQLFP
jgi:alpha-tubulin suppressor-like RCC1 family protein